MSDERLRLQLFADGASDGSGDAGEGTADAGQTTENSTGTKAERFSELIAGEFKDEFRDKTQNIIDKRFKQTKTLEGRLSRLAPVLENLYGQFGVSDGDDDALLEAFERDAADKKAKSENEAARARADIDVWLNEAGALSEVYPSFDFRSELKSNPEFARLLKAGVPVKSAYEVIHKDEILGGAMEYTAKKVSEQVARGIESKAARPLENGLGTGTGVRTGVDVNTLSNGDILDILKKVKSGAKITFG